MSIIIEDKAFDSFVLNPGDLVRFKDAIGIVVAVTDVCSHCRVMWCHEDGIVFGDALTILLNKVK